MVCFCVYCAVLLAILKTVLCVLTFKKIISETGCRLVFLCNPLEVVAGYQCLSHTYTHTHM